MCESNAIRVCPLCGSNRVTVSEPNPIQARQGIGYILRCACGAVATITVLKRSQTAAKHELAPTE